MSYYGAGDYYGAGGLGSFLGGLARTATSFITGGPVAAASTAIRSIAGGGQPRGPSIVPAPGVIPAIQRIVPGGKTGLMVEPGRRKRRRMQYTNQKALRRANRRVDGFVREVKKSLKHTNYKLVTKSSRAAKRPVSVKESGSGSVIVT